MNIDQSFLLVLYSARDMTGVGAFISITELGSTITIGGLALATGLLLLYKRRIEEFAGLVVAVLGTVASVFALKEIVLRARPDLIYQAYTETGHSFPSGHAALSFALYVFLAYIIYRSGQTRFMTLIYGAIAVLVVLIGFSRLYLGVHYLSDVFGGWFIAAIFVWLGIETTKWLERKLGSE